MSLIAAPKKPTDWLFVAVGLLCLLPMVGSPVALILGLVLASLGWVPQGIKVGPLSKKLLAVSIVGLGFGVPLEQALTATRDGLGIIVATIFGTLSLGWMLTRAFQVEQKTGYLISAGTAICGGSAIAAVAPAIDAKAHQISLALGTVFVLNSVALFVFPFVGHLLEMSQYDFGIWAAIAIHDTSSVVGAASSYGDEALLTATTLKLARALWIVPVALISAWLFGSGERKLSVPNFILFYIVAIGVAYLLPQLSALYEVLFFASKRVLVLCLFLIGAGITIERMKEAGPRPLLLGIALWVVISLSSLFYILLV